MPSRLVIFVGACVLVTSGLWRESAILLIACAAALAGAAIVLGRRIASQSELRAYGDGCSGRSYRGWISGASGVAIPLRIRGACVVLCLARVHETRWFVLHPSRPRLYATTGARQRLPQVLADDQSPRREPFVTPGQATLLSNEAAFEVCLPGPGPWEIELRIEPAAGLKRRMELRVLVRVYGNEAAIDWPDGLREVAPGPAFEVVPLPAAAVGSDV